MKKQAQNFGAEYIHGAVVDTDLSRRPFRVNVEGEWIETLTLIIASGASARWLGLSSEQKLIGHGVSSCATCDGFFYKGKKIMVVGGGDSAMEEANFLTRFGSEVALVHRRPQFRASKIMLDRVRNNPKIQFLTEHGGGRRIGCFAGNCNGRPAAQPGNGSGLGTGRGRLLRRDRAHPQHGRFQRTDRNRRGRLYFVEGRRQDQHSRRIPCRRCAGSRVPAGDHGVGRGLHGGHGSRTVPRSGRPLKFGAGVIDALPARRDRQNRRTRLIERITPPGVPTPRGPYSPAVRAGDFIFVAGQGPVDTTTDEMSLAISAMRPGWS